MAATTIARKGYGQVEPNHLSGIVTGQIYAQLPAKFIDTNDSNTVKPVPQLEQGVFMKYNYAANYADRLSATDGEWLLCYNEEKLYDEREQMHRDFVLKADDFTDGMIYPRLIKTNVGDIYTTNMFGALNTGRNDTVGTSVSLDVGYYLTPANNTGILGVIYSSGTTPQTDISSVTGMIWKVVKVYTMPDGQVGVKIQRVQ